MTLTLDLLRSLLANRGPLSAYSAAKALMCRPEEICVMANDDWWHILKSAGPEGFVYQIRPVISTTKKMAKEIGIYNDSGIVKKTGWSP